MSHSGDENGFDVRAVSSHENPLCMFCCSSPSDIALLKYIPSGVCVSCMSQDISLLVECNCRDFIGAVAFGSLFLEN